MTEQINVVGMSCGGSVHAQTQDGEEAHKDGDVYSLPKEQGREAVNANGRRRNNSTVKKRIYNVV